MDTYNKDALAAQAVNTHSELNDYQSVLQFVVGTEYKKEYVNVDAILQQLNGYSNSLLLYEIRAGINAITAARSHLAIQWEHAWLN
jgi:hypothetical protein